MTPTTEAPARTYTEQILDVLCLFNGCRGAIPVTVETLNGIGRDQFGLAPPFPKLPRALLAALNPDDNRAIRMRAATMDGGVEADIGFLFSLFRPDVKFDASTSWHHAIDPAAQERIRDVLAEFPLAPAFFIDAGPEAVALWPLSAPLAIDGDPARAVKLLADLAERLDGDAEAARDLTTITLPLAGVIRNFNLLPPEHVEIVDFAPGAKYSIDQFEAALSPQTETETTPRKKVRA